MEMLKNKSFWIGVIVVAVVAFLFAVGRAGATNGHSNDNVPGQECEQGIHTYNPHCVTPTLTVTPSVTPEVSVEPTATPSGEAPADSNVSDNRVDQFSCTINDCNTHKADRPVVVPSAAPNTGYPPCSEPRTCGWK